MKKILFGLICSAFLFACNQNAHQEDAHTHEAIDTVHSTALTLNNGAKWKADSITNHNVVNLKTIADNFRIKPFPTVGEYQLLSTDLSNGLNTMIQQCKMTGPDHEALHHWLEPILNENKELKNVQDTAAGRSIFRSIDKKIDSYKTYFE
jgi:hypothetical protein